MITDIFEGEQSIYKSGTTDIKEILRRISDRYMADHPRQTFGMRPYIGNVFQQDEDTCYLFDFDSKFPDAKDGSYCYAMSFIECEEKEIRAIHMDTQYNSQLYINGELICKTNVENESMPTKSKILYTFNKGKNVVLIKAKKNALGFKVVFGEGIVTNKPLYFRTPFIENNECLGWLYTTPFEEDIYKTLDELPDINGNQPSFWYPTPESMADTGAVLGNNSGYVYACSNLSHRTYTDSLKFLCDCNEECEIYIDGEKVYCGNGKNEFSAHTTPGLHYIAVQIKHDGSKELIFNIKAFADGENIDFEPLKCVRSNTPWLYMGVSKERNDSLTKAFDINLLGKTKDGFTYYRAGLTNKFMRPVREDSVYGAWTYPLGVVMYGLLETAKELDAKDISDYAVEHICTSTKIQKYATWDKESYGAAIVNGQNVTLKLLDFCGSFGNAVLLGSEFTENNESMIDVANYISDYIKNKQQRLDNGMFFRVSPGTYQDNTIWADDLYMSVPFLCRYYTFTGQKEFLEDAVNQILCFKEYLYMPEKKLMGHVYNLNYNLNTRVPWGRGNGWVLFSFSELLAVLPENHEKREILLDFFRELCVGVLSHQDEYGMWHQLVNDPDSYRETSCTAMFICAFARGVRNGWLEKKFADSTLKGWNALCNYAIDGKGNVYGVCLGSRYSFRPEYYKHELLWHTNDLHGTGIVMLAGVEVNKLIEAL